MYRFIIIFVLILLAHGKAINAQQNVWIKIEKSSLEEPGSARVYQVYHDGAFDYIKVDYTQGGPYRSFAGRIMPTGDLAGGRFSYADGSMYEGFTYKGKFFGPGKFSDKTGAVRQGIWKMDSLSIAMPVRFPVALFEPVAKTDFDPTRFYFSNNRPGAFAYKFFDAGEGWVLGMDRDNIIFGKTDGKTFSGPAVWISKSNSPINTIAGDQWITYRTGIFKNGMLSEGMRIRDYIKWIRQDNNGSYELSESSITEGQFLYDMLWQSCGKKTYYTSNGYPYKKLEGFFEKDNTRGEETCLGWMYVNDWTALRNPENLKFYYENQDLFNGATYPGHWYVSALQKTADQSYCYPSMQLQSVTLAKKLGHIADSVLVATAKEDNRVEESLKMLAEARKRSAAQNAACLQMTKASGLRIGMTITNYEVIGVVKELDCARELVTVMIPVKAYGESSTSQTFPLSSFGPLGKWKTAAKQYNNCQKCNGHGGESVTYRSSKTKELPFGYFSGIQTTVTKTKTETFWEVCDRCSGSGLTLQ